MDYDLILSTGADAHTIARLWPLYQYELSCVGGMPINTNGLFEEQTVESMDYVEVLGPWWERPDALYPFLVRVDGRPAGFVMVGAAPDYAPEGRDYLVHEFFFLHSYWGTGLAEWAAGDIFRRLPGRWELRTIPQNHRAVAFWRKTIGRHASNAFIEDTRFVTEHDAEAVVFQFETSP